MMDGSAEKLVCPMCQELWPPDYGQCRKDGADLISQESGPDMPFSPDAVAAAPAGLEAPSMTWRLSVEGRGEFDVPAGQTVVLGRSADLASSPMLGSFDTISRFHCTVMAGADLLKVCDMDSTNGTFVNNVRLEPRAVHDVGPHDALRLASNVGISILLLAHHPVRQQPAKEGSQ
jgi:hypothetical protein